MLFFSRLEKLILGVCLVTLTACSGVWLFIHLKQSPEQTSEKLLNESPLPVNEKPEKVVVHVAGRVKHPGVYELPLNSRVKDAIHSAGGHLANADIDRLNLAKILEDGEKVYVPDRAEESLGKNSASITPVGKQTSKPASMKKGSGLAPKSIDLNRANPIQLQRLPGVGPATAKLIVEYRKSNGPFSTIEDLMKVRGIGPKRFEKMKPFLRV